jgi:hypothetical protein
MADLHDLSALDAAATIRRRGKAGEAELLALSAQAEAAAPWADRHPAIWRA